MVTAHAPIRSYDIKVRGCTPSFSEAAPIEWSTPSPDDADWGPAVSRVLATLRMLGETYT